ncbi:MAG TPA: glycine betaine ABC transporter substrate-binding protein [Bryobacteraceae bacterium]|nr:glycine betaine ABC transporter substrate-binding protein [Bryobacteraceae bacterium]
MDRAAILILMASLAAGCSSTPRITVGSKNFTEQVLLGEIVAGHIERRLNLTLDRKLNLGGTLLAHEALKSGSIDLYPEYTGTALTAVLKQPAINDAKLALEQVREGYRTWRLEWLPPFGFNNSFAMVVRADTTREHGVRTLSDAARRPAPWRLGVGYEFTQRPDGLSGLVHTYGLRVAGDPVAMDLGLLYPALQAKTIDMAAANATDGMLARPEFVVLDDDRHYFPPYECAIVVRQEALERHPRLRPVLAELSGRISESVMRRMNGSVDVEHRPATEVAREFLNEWR